MIRIVMSAIRRTLIAGATTTVLATGALGLSTTAYATQAPATLTLAALSSPLDTPSSPRPTYCFFGTHHGKGSGCRGGSVFKGTRHAVDKCVHTIMCALPPTMGQAND